MILPSKSQGSVSWQSPSNIALIKYWGKHGNQIPNNASLSFTLSNAHTNTSVDYIHDPATITNLKLEFLFEGKPNTSFERRIHSFLLRIQPEMEFIKHSNLKINSRNSFPHSSGIASSASALSALALCLCEIDEKIRDIQHDKDSFTSKASHIARLGSGSACRSVIPKMAIWGAHNAYPSSDLVAHPISVKLHPLFDNFHDDILIISPDEKPVSSSAGHALMQGNPFAEERYKQANNRLEDLIAAMQNGDMATFGKIVEDEALTLHALMMCSDPSYILMRPNTLLAIERIRKYRTESKLPLFFTLDAGPNIHLLYPDGIQSEVAQFIEISLKPLCFEGKIIYDQVGHGPQKLG